jgi:hypothetical protein
MMLSGLKNYLRMWTKMLRLYANFKGLLRHPSTASRPLAGHDGEFKEFVAVGSFRSSMARSESVSFNGG